MISPPWESTVNFFDAGSKAVSYKHPRQIPLGV
jgi:hypothetical protein